MGVDIAGVLFPIWPDGGVAPLPELPIDFGGTARTRFAPLSLAGTEGAGGWFSGCGFNFLWVRPADAPVDFYGRRPAHLIGDVGVDVQRGAAGYVTDDGGEGLDVHSMFQRNRGKCVSKIVKAYFFAPSPLQNGLQSLSDSGWISGRALVDRGGEHPFRRHGFLVCFKNIEGRGRKNDTPVGCFGFGRGDYQLSSGPVDLPLHPEFPGAEVEVVPLEGADFAPTQAGGEFQQQEFKAAVLFGLNQQPLDLLRSQHLHLSGLGGRETAAIRGVAEDELFGDSFVQCCVECGVDAPNSLVGKTLAVELSPEKPTILFEISVELLDIVGGQLAQLCRRRCRPCTRPSILLPAGSQG